MTQAIMGMYEAAKAQKREVSDAELLQVHKDIVRISNLQYGDLDKKDGYNCPVCRNKGFLFKLFISEMGYLVETTKECKCMEMRKGYERSRTSGLPEGYELDNYFAKTDWQKAAKSTAQKYLDDKAYKQGAFLFAGGAVGSGKTHLITGVAREIVFERDIRFMNWVRDGREIKRVADDNFAYSNELYRLTSVDVLIIDDLYHGSATEADKTLAYEIINDRYINGKATLITSEKTMEDLYRCDESVASRIYERCKGYSINIGADRTKNQRL